jgi:hypothetical protein
MWLDVRATPLRQTCRDRVAAACEHAQLAVRAFSLAPFDTCTRAVAWRINE